MGMLHTFSHVRVCVCVHACVCVYVCVHMLCCYKLVVFEAIVVICLNTLFFFSFKKMIFVI